MTLTWMTPLTAPNVLNVFSTTPGFAISATAGDDYPYSDSSHLNNIAFTSSGHNPYQLRSPALVRVEKILPTASVAKSILIGPEVTGKGLGLLVADSVAGDEVWPWAVLLEDATKFRPTEGHLPTQGLRLKLPHDILLDGGKDVTSELSYR
ncbi:MAG: hypothetical protein M1816_001651 [Peltula sp. TS41687]|nr:MAG: hypothetical protein M1816_001651 [Peltula sp. TS41687]